MMMMMTNHAGSTNCLCACALLEASDYYISVFVHQLWYLISWRQGFEMSVYRCVTPAHSNTHNYADRFVCR